MKEIVLYGGKRSQVDDEDFERINMLKWYLRVHHGNEYATANDWDGVKNHVLGMARVVMCCARGDGHIVDHIDGNGLNNQKSNLRKVTTQQNACNLKCSSHKEYKGVFVNRRAKAKPFMARLCFHGEDMYLGVFSTAEEAAQAYNEASVKYHGEFGRLNIITKPIQAVKHVRKTQNRHGYWGVNYDKRQPKKPYIAQVKHCNRMLAIGSFKTAEEAAREYDRAARVLHGDSAHLNFEKVG